MIPPRTAPSLPTMPAVADVSLDPALVGLIRELSTGMDDASAIVVRYGYTGLDDPRWLALQHNHAFDAQLRSAIREWQAVTSTPKRVRLKALTLLEANILNIQDVVGSTNLGNRVDGFKFLYQLAGLGGTPENPIRDGGGSGFSITLNIGTGAGNKTLVVKSESAGSIIEHEDTPPLSVVLAEGDDA